MRAHYNLFGIPFLKELGQSVGDPGGVAGENLVAFSDRYISCLCYDCRGFCVKLWIATRLNCWLSYIILNENNAIFRMYYGIRYYFRIYWFTFI